MKFPVKSKEWGVSLNHVPADEDKKFQSLCPYGQPGDRLWMRETFGLLGRALSDGEPIGEEKKSLCYKATDNVVPHIIKWRPSIHMPRWASRITLEITNVRVERLQDITKQDAEEEGCAIPCAQCGYTLKDEGIQMDHHLCSGEGPGDSRKKFEYLWNKINGPGAWEKNPWVWVIEFKTVERKTQ